MLTKTKDLNGLWENKPPLSKLRISGVLSCHLVVLKTIVLDIPDIFNKPGLGSDLRKDNARHKYTMKRPYSTHLSYEKNLAGLNDILDFSSI